MDKPISSAFPTPASALDPDYYLKNFLVVLSFVLERDAHLFIPAEEAVIEGFLSLGEDERRLYIRLFNRKGPLFLVEKLNYPEIEDIHASAQVLAGRGLMEINPTDDDIADILKLFTAPELKTMLRAIDPAASLKGKRADIEARVLALPRPILLDHIRGDKQWVGLKHQALFERVMRLFFLNSGQDQSLLVVIDLAHMQFPTYESRRSRPVFIHRQALLDYEATLQEREMLSALVEAGDLPQIVAFLEALLKDIPLRQGHADTLGHFLDRYTPHYRRARLISWAISTLERAKCHAEAIVFLEALLARPYLSRRRAHWWDRLVKDLIHLGKKAEAVAQAQRALADPHVKYADRHNMAKRLARLQKQLKIPHTPPTVLKKAVSTTIHRKLSFSAPHRRTLFLGLSGEEMVVEALALEYYATEGYQGLGSENLLFTTLFGLLFWDIIFHPVDDVFQTPFQVAPLDLHTPHFYQSRKALIHQRLASIREHRGLSHLENALAHRPQACRGVVWESYPPEVLAHVLSLFGGERLATIMQPLAEDYRLFSRGLPDLLIWNGEGELKLVEVKGPRDRLSKEQEAWIERLLEGGIGVELCLVKEA